MLSINEYVDYAPRSIKVRKKIGQADGRTDGRTPDRYITLIASRCQHNNIIR